MRRDHSFAVLASLARAMGYRWYGTQSHARQSVSPALQIESFCDVSDSHRGRLRVQYCDDTKRRGLRKGFAVSCGSLHNLAVSTVARPLLQHPCCICCCTAKVAFLRGDLRIGPASLLNLPSFRPKGYEAELYSAVHRNCRL